MCVCLCAAAVLVCVYVQVSWLRSQFPSLDIEVDGGVGPSNVHKCAEVSSSDAGLESAFGGISPSQSVSVPPRVRPEPT